MKTKQVMHKGVEWVSPDTPVRKLAKMMKEFDIGAVPIGEGDKLVGMVTDRDLCLRALADGKDIEFDDGSRCDDCGNHLVPRR